MAGVLFWVVLIAAVVSRPVEARLWRAGRISDRTTTILLLGRFPVVVFLFAVLAGAGPLFVAALTALATIPGLALYRFMLQLLREREGHVTPAQPIWTPSEAEIEAAYDTYQLESEDALRATRRMRAATLTPEDPEAGAAAIH